MSTRAAALIRERDCNEDRQQQQREKKLYRRDYRWRLNVQLVNGSMNKLEGLTAVCHMGGKPAERANEVINVFGWKRQRGAWEPGLFSLKDLCYKFISVWKSGFILHSQN